MTTRALPICESSSTNANADDKLPVASRRYSRRAITTNPPVDDGDESRWPLGVVWLMVRHLDVLCRMSYVSIMPHPRFSQSFPNSGTSYTLHATRELTNTTTATNYGLEGMLDCAN